MMEFVRELPEWAKSCDYFDERAEGYLCFLMSGKRYYVPLTKEMKALFGISRRGDKLVFKVEKTRMRLERILRDLGGALHLQIRDTVGAQISSDLSGQLTDFLENKLGPGFDSLVEGQMQKRLSAGDDE